MYGADKSLRRLSRYLSRTRGAREKVRAARLRTSLPQLMTDGAIWDAAAGAGLVLQAAGAEPGAYVLEAAERLLVDSKLPAAADPAATFEAACAKLGLAVPPAVHSENGVHMRSSELAATGTLYPGVYRYSYSRSSAIWSGRGARRCPRRQTQTRHRGVHPRIRPGRIPCASPCRLL